MRERDFQAAVVELARLAGWRCYHTFDSRRSEPGFPDLCLVRGGQIVFAELKTAHGRLSAAQREWLAALGACPGVDAVLWRPEDWDEIEGVLIGGRAGGWWAAELVPSVRERVSKRG